MMPTSCTRVVALLYETMRHSVSHDCFRNFPWCTENRTATDLQGLAESMRIESWRSIFGLNKALEHELEITDLSDLFVSGVTRFSKGSVMRVGLVCPYYYLVSDISAH